MDPDLDICLATKLIKPFVLFSLDYIAIYSNYWSDYVVDLKTPKGFTGCGLGGL